MEPAILNKKIKFSTLWNNAKMGNQKVGIHLLIFANTETNKHFFSHRIYPEFTTIGYKITYKINSLEHLIPQAHALGCVIVDKIH